MNSNNTIQFQVDDVRGKGRPRFTRDGHVYTDAKTKNYEQLIAISAKAAMQRSGIKQFTKGVELTLNIHVKNVLAKPDIDNVEKAVMDALNKIAYLDDKQVIKKHTEKITNLNQKYIEVTLRELP